MSTVKDVARLAGVSHGTVSNVLNGKPGVSPDKVEKVLKAVETLGYVPDQTAKHLKTAASSSIAVILPNITDPHFARLFTGAERVISESGYTVALYITGEIPAKEHEILEEIHRNRAAGVILVSCSPEDTERFSRMESAGIEFVFVERERSSRAGNFVECDSGELIRDAAEELLNKGLKDIVLVVGPDEYSSERHCVEAFTSAYENRGLKAQERFIRITNFDRESAFREAVATFEGSDIPEAVITSSSLLMEGVYSAFSLTNSLLPLKPEFITLAEDSWTADPDDGIARLRRPSIHLGERAAEILLDHLKGEDFLPPKRVRVQIPKRRLKAEQRPYRARPDADPLRVLLLEGSHAHALSALIPSFQAKTGIEVEFVTQPYESMYEALTASSGDGSADVLQIDIPWISELARGGCLLDLTSHVEANPDTIADFIPGILDAFTRIDERIVAFPYLFGTQLLFYRKDLFENEVIRNAYRARFRKELKPPATWPEFNAVASFFTRSLNPESPVPYGTTLGSRISSGAVCEFLPRLWGFGGEVFSEKGGILLDSPEGVWALSNYAESFAYASPESKDYWWDEQVAEFTRGDTAMMVLFIAHATEINNRKASKVVGRIGYAPVPGGTSLLGGWSLAINSKSSAKDRAFEFISWATGPETAIPATILGGTTSSIGLYKSSELLSVYPWLPKALESFTTIRKRMLPRSYLDAGFSEREFEKILGNAVYQCVTGACTPEEALARAAGRLRTVVRS